MGNKAKREITVKEFIQKLQNYYPTVTDPKALKLVLQSTAGVFDTVLHDKSVDLELARLTESMAGIIHSLEQVPEETVIHREVVKALKEICCSQWPDQCGTSCD